MYTKHECFMHVWKMDGCYQFNFFNIYTGILKCKQKTLLYFHSEID